MKGDDGNWILNKQLSLHLDIKTKMLSTLNKLYDLYYVFENIK